MFEVISDPVPCDHCGEHRPVIRFLSRHPFELCRQCLAAALELLEDLTSSMSDDQRPPPRNPYEALRRLVEARGNAFGVGALVGPGGPKVRILSHAAVALPLERDEAANLVAWIIMLAELERADLVPIFEQQGIPWP